MKLIVTIDTEEDNWKYFNAKDNPVQNIERIISLQKLFDEFEVQPTYLITYPVATNPQSKKILKNILEKDRCEIGMHCHPWNTPPFNGNKNIDFHDTMLSNLPYDMVKSKLAVLDEAIRKHFNIKPVSFRAGRWAFSPIVGNSLSTLGYRIDTSITPFVDWREYYGPDFSDYGMEPFWMMFQDLNGKYKHGQLLEIPVTIGFLQSNFRLCRKLLKTFEKPYARKLHIAGILERLRLFNQVWLSPELSSIKDMIKLAKIMEKKKIPFLNFTFHSTSLIGGLSPFVKTKSDEKIFINKIKTFLQYALEAGYKSIKLSSIEKSIGQHLRKKML